MTEYQERELIGSIRQIKKELKEIRGENAELRKRLEPSLPKHNKFLTIQQAAKIANCCEAQARKNCKDAVWSFAIKQGKKWVIPENELIQFIGNNWWAG